MVSDFGTVSLPFMALSKLVFHHLDDDRDRPALAARA
jgi:hypothetical protein